MSAKDLSNLDSDAPVGVPVDNSYANPRGGNNDVVPVVKDTADVESGVQGDGGEDSDAVLQRDDTDAIDQSNIIEDRTRGAAKSQGSYAEPGDEEGLPEDDGRSAVAQ